MMTTEQRSAMETATERELEGGVTSGHVSTTASRPLPFNSKKITGAMMKQLARGLEIPATGGGAELRLLVEGKLVKLGREPRNIQLSVVTRENGVTLSLQDADSVFLTVDPIPVELRTESDHEEGGDGDEVTEDGITELREALAASREAQEAKDAEITRLKAQLAAEKTKYRSLWEINCAQLAEFDSTVSEKDDEIHNLRSQLHDRTPTAGSVITRGTTPEADRTELRQQARRGKGPPIDHFAGEDPRIELDDWLKALERASKWYNWMDDEKLMQLAGHLRGRAFEEWNLLKKEEVSSYESAVSALRERLDPGNKVLASQDFRHANQGENESVSDFVRRLERFFYTAYGKDKMGVDTREAILYGQLHEGLKLSLIKSPTVSGALTYKELIMAAKNEERRQAEFRKRVDYAKNLQKSTRTSAGKQSPDKPLKERDKPPEAKQGMRVEQRACHNCKAVGHLVKNCPKRKSESTGQSERSNKPKPTTKQVVTEATTNTSMVELSPSKEPLDLLLPDSDEEGIKQVRVNDRGSKARYVDILIQGVPVTGVIDTGADITIMNGTLLKKVAATAKLKKKQLKKADKCPRTYDRRQFSLDGRLDLDITFGEKTMSTPIYLKMDAHDELLLSEGVCSQLGIVSYHTDVHPGVAPVAKPLKGSVDPTQSGLDAVGDEMATVDNGVQLGSEARVPLVRVSLVKSVTVLPGQTTMVDVKLTSGCNLSNLPVLVEGSASVEKKTGLRVEDALVAPDDEGMAKMSVWNPSGFSQTIERGIEMGVLCPDYSIAESVPAGLAEATMKQVASQLDGEQRKELLLQLIPDPDIPPQEREQLLSLLQEYHTSFSLEAGERGETDLVEMKIDTDDSSPRRQPVRRMPFSVNQEIARLLQEMQVNGVIQPSESPWASPVVLVRKKDGSHRFCVDYRKLNLLTKPDTYPLPRIDDLLDKLAGAKYFSTLDLASGFWQIKMHPDSREKTAFITPHGLYEFRVMPFGLCNAPSVFQTLMNRVLSGLNPAVEEEFVSVYIDDLLVYSKTLSEHLSHLGRVLERLEKAGLKLKASKCHFARKEVQYLGHVLTPDGVKPNPALVRAVERFPLPTNLKGVRRFLGMASYYRKFIPQFSKVAEPLHKLTRKNSDFHWSEECNVAFESLKGKLIEAPVLVYPSFTEPFILETDASIQGLGAVLSQKQLDGRHHPIAFASRALSPTERNYSITELETLAVVWALSHFRFYLYGNSVKVLTDHSAVKAVLMSPNPSGKHARWWTRVFGSGIKEVNIVYRSGKENVVADALSRSPEAPARETDVFDLHVASVKSTVEQGDITSLMKAPASEVALQTPEDKELSLQQRADAWAKPMIMYLEDGVLPGEEQTSMRLIAQSKNFAVHNGILYLVEGKRNKRAVLPEKMRVKVLEETHQGLYGGHFSGQRTYNTLSQTWWWENMYRDTIAFVRGCPHCAIVTGTERRNRPSLCPIPVERPFQILGMDIMELPKTDAGNRYAIVMQDLFTKWPLVFAAPDQKTLRLAKLIAEEVVLAYGVPEALLTDRGTNLLSHLMMDLCDLLGIRKLNTTAYHPECDGLVERFNRTLKTMIRKHVQKFGSNWDQFLPGLLWAYRNVPHESTGEKPSYLLFGYDCRSPTEAALMPPTPPQSVDVDDYRQEMTLSLSSARDIAAASIRSLMIREVSLISIRLDSGY